MAVRDSRAIPAGFGILFLVGLILLTVGLHFLTWPQIEAGLQLSPLECPLKHFTGWQCAFCGMTHSWLALLRGEWVRAIQFNFLGPFVLAVAISVAFVAIFRPKTHISAGWAKRFGGASLLILISYTVLRNLK
jgi:hypothetical protein